MRSPSTSERRLGREGGFTTLEVMIGVALLGVAIVAMLGTLGRTTETANYTDKRNQSLDQLRLMAADFSKDVRQAVRATAVDTDSITIQTYVNGALQTVTWSAEPDPQGDRFRRSMAGSPPSVHVVDLTSRDVFSYFGETDPTQVNRVRLSLATRPDVRFPAVSLETDLEMRNVP